MLSAVDLGPTLSNSRSVTQHFWKQHDVEERDVLMIMQRYRVPEIVARVLATKQIPDGEIEHYLSPTLRHLLPDPFHLKDMKKGVERFLKAIKNQEHIAIFGDYDVDGATSSALLKRYLDAINHPHSSIYIPDRIEEGYGPNSQAMKYLKEQGASLIITVDCGTLAFEAIETATKCNLDVIVLDHHLGDQNLPDACAIINPNRVDETSEYRYLAGVGVTFLFLVAVHTIFRNDAPTKNINLFDYLDLVALGTVCDVVPLIGINRAFVCQGLKILSQRKNIGLNALMDVANIDDTPTSYHLGFILGPRINAGGRVGESSLGATLLSTHTPTQAHNIAIKLNQYNEERKAIEMHVLDEAMTQASQHPENTAMIIVASENWHPGVIGIVAGRIKEQFNKPTAVISLENGIGKASARSIPGIDLGAAIVNACHRDILICGGGHAMAAGFTVAEDKIEQLKTYLHDMFASTINDLQKEATRYFYGFLSTHSLSTRLYHHIESLGPFGSGNPTPLFVFPNMLLQTVSLHGQQVIRCHIEKEGKRSIAVAFQPHDSDLANALLENQGKIIHILGRLKINRWQGRETIEITITDILTH